jgi:hypothetical protein
MANQRSNHHHHHYHHLRATWRQTAAKTRLVASPHRWAAHPRLVRSTTVRHAAPLNGRNVLQTNQTNFSSPDAMLCVFNKQTSAEQQYLFSSRLASGRESVKVRLLHCILGKRRAPRAE